MQIYKNFQLSNILWYKIGGKARYLIEVTSEKDILDAFDFIFENKIEQYFVVGLGANLLFTDEFFDGVVIRIISKATQQIVVNRNIITSYSGETLDAVIQTAFKHNLIGLSWAGGLPGTVGAAIRGNVGAFGGEIKDVTVKTNILKIMDDSYNIAILNNEALNFSYRNSIIKQNKSLIVLSAMFQLQEASTQDLKEAKQEYKANIDYRNTHHPHDFPNTGSCFKNIKNAENITKVLDVWPDVKKLSEEKWHGKISVGYINNRLGFSGLKIGAAQVSKQHANFINNTRDATANDVLAIIKTIQKKYRETFGFEPEPEVEIVR